ncbi:MAG TPA: hypothetical protein PKW21_15025 [Rhabdaerophilum sp.]|nr:hypothetical protein [Rhabdaerophilum sp.]
MTSMDERTLTRRKLKKAIPVVSEEGISEACIEILTFCETLQGQGFSAREISGGLSVAIPVWLRRTEEPDEVHGWAKLYAKRLVEATEGDGPE